MNGLELLALMHVRTLPRGWDRPRRGDWARELARFPLFAGVSKRRLRALARHATPAEFLPGETIVFRGEDGDSLFVVLSGFARTASTVLGAGDYFGEVAMIDGRPRSARVVAMSYVYVLKLPSRSVLRLARRHPAITLAMLEDLAARLRRLEAATG